jgi:hypothetical protein
MRMMIAALALCLMVPQAQASGETTGTQICVQVDDGPVQCL